MKSKIYSDHASGFGHDRPTQPTHQNEPHLVVQILSVIAFGVFSIVGIYLAFATFWVAGLALAAMVTMIWAGSRTFGSLQNWNLSSPQRSIDEQKSETSVARSSGNMRFDAKRSEMLAQLERESREFDDFLIRLRESGDAAEFDRFMDDRANLAKLTGSQTGPEKGSA